MTETYPPGIPVPDDILDGLALGGTWLYRHLEDWRTDATLAEATLLACVCTGRRDTWDLVSTIVDADCFRWGARSRLWNWLGERHAAGDRVRHIVDQDRLLSCIGDPPYSDPHPVALVAVRVRLADLERHIAETARRLATDPTDTATLDRLTQLRATVADWDAFRTELLAHDSSEEAGAPCAQPPPSPALATDPALMT